MPSSTVRLLVFVGAVAVAAVAVAGDLPPESQTDVIELAQLVDSDLDGVLDFQDVCSDVPNPDARRITLQEWWQHRSCEVPSCHI